MPPDRDAFEVYYSHDLQTATTELIDSLAQGNPGLTRPSGYDRVKFGGRQGLRAATRR